MFTNKIVRLGLPSLLCLLSLAGCATVGSVIGGKKDLTGPVLVSTLPENKTHAFKAKRIVFTFDEFINPGDISKEIFISPVPPTRPKSYIVNRNVVLEFTSKLAANTTYVITLGTGIKNTHEKTGLKQPIQYAFTTGAVLDTFQIEGSIYDSYAGQGEKNMIVALYSPDSVKGDSFFKKKPNYVALSDTSGNFTLAYLRPGRYKIFAFTDGDNSFSYNQANERIALDPDTSIIAIDTNRTQEIHELTSFLPDTTAPKPAGYEVLNAKTVAVEFNEPVTGGAMRTANQPQEVPRVISDTNGVYAAGDTKKLLFYSATDLPDSFRIRFLALRDTAGNQRDTSYTIKVKSHKFKKKRLDIKQYDKPMDIYQMHFQSNVPLTADSLPGKVYILDTGKKKIPVQLKLRNYDLWATIPNNLDTNKKARYVLVFDSTLNTESGYPLRKEVDFAVTVPDADAFGSVKGQILAKQENLIVTFIEDKTKPKGKPAYGERHFTFGRKISYKYLKPGTYLVQVVEDRDHSGSWTPGRLFPRTLPEPVFLYPLDKLVVRPGWEIEKYELPYPPQ